MVETLLFGEARLAGTFLIAFFSCWRHHVALFEQAGLTSDLAAKNRLVAFANNYIVYREQHEAVHPAFTPDGTQPGGPFGRRRIPMRTNPSEATC